MAFPTQGVLDDFNRGDSASLGSNFTEGDLVDSDTTFEIVSNQCANVAASGGTASARWNVETFGPDSEVFCTAVNLPADTGDRNSIAARIVQPGISTADGYALAIRFDGTTQKFRLQRIDNGSDTDLGAEVNSDMVAGDKFGLEIIGTTLKGYRESGGTYTEKISRTDSNHSAAGNLGIFQWQVPASEVDPALDDFGGGTVGAAVGRGLLLSDQRNSLIYGG